MGDAVQLVSFGANKQLVLHEEGLRTLRLFSSSLSILSVVGPSRCGKYDLSFFFFFLFLFSVLRSHSCCAKG